MKIIITDIFQRKAFDIISILKMYFSSDTLLLLSEERNIGHRIFSKLLYGVKNVIIDGSSYHNYRTSFLLLSEQFENEDLVFLPMEEDSIEMFLMFIKDEGKRNFKYLLPSLEAFKISKNKEQLNLYCQTINVPVPKIISENDFSIGNYNFPVVLKPKEGSGSKGIMYIENDKDLAKINSPNFEDVFIQEKLSNSVSVEGAFFMFIDGVSYSFYGHERLRTFPEKGGVSVFSKSKVNKELENIGIHLLSSLNWEGVAMIEFIHDNTDNTYKLIEINPRFWGTIMLSEFINTNLIINYIKGCIGEELIEPSITTQDKYIRWVFPYDIILYFKSGFKTKFFSKNKFETCYINWSYTSTYKSIIFLVYNLLKPSHFKNLWKKIYRN